MPAFREYQRPVMVGICRGMQREPGGTYTVMFSRQAGKNELAAALVAGLLNSASFSGGRIIVCAPTFSPQALISVARAHDLLTRAGHATRPWRIERQSIRIGKAVATYLGANQDANVAGHTASVALVADEAQDIDRDWFDRQFRPMVASTGAPIMMFGTPWNGQSLLEEAVQQNLRIKRSRHYRVGWEDVAAEVEAYGRYVRGERERLGPGHHIFRTQYELESGQPGHAFLSERQLRLLRGRHQRIPEPAPGERYVAGLDVGGDGDNADATVLTIGRVKEKRLEIVEHLAWQGATFGELIGGLRAVHRSWGLARLTVDATGIGMGLASGLEDAGLPVQRFTFTRATKSELGNALIAAIETGALAIYSDDGSPERAACFEELRYCMSERVNGGLLRWGNQRGHDDYVASLALCLHAARAIGAPRVATGRRR